MLCRVIRKIPVLRSTMWVLQLIYMPKVWRPERHQGKHHSLNLKRNQNSLQSQVCLLSSKRDKANRQWHLVGLPDKTTYSTITT